MQVMRLYKQGVWSCLVRRLPSFLLVGQHKKPARAGGRFRHWLPAGWRPGGRRGDQRSPCGSKPPRKNFWLSGSAPADDHGDYEPLGAMIVPI
jgi:hypothetical protein